MTYIKKKLNILIDVTWIKGYNDRQSRNTQPTAQGQGKTVGNWRNLEKIRHS